MYMSILRLSSTLESFKKYVAKNEQFDRNHPSAKVSSFWASIFNERPNFPELGELVAFRRNNNTWGSGDTWSEDIDIKKKEFQDTLETIKLFVPEEYLISIDEPVQGAPYIFKKDGIVLSANFAMNSGTAWNLISEVKARLEQSKELNICEIGAGFGACAYMLHQALPIANYTIVDLPENLCLSSTYLGTVLQDKVVKFIDCQPTLKTVISSNTLNFTLPSGIDNIDSKYDLMLNSFSFHEMDLEAVNSYFEFADRVLSNTGILVSFNSHDKAGVRKASQYSAQGLKLVGLKTFRSVPTGFFNTIAYEMIFVKNENREFKTDPRAIDVVCEMMQLGLDSDLKAIVEELLKGQITEKNQELIESAHAFFYTKNENERKRHVQTMAKDTNNVIFQFLVGNYKILDGDIEGAKTHLERSCALGLKDFALLRSKVILAIIYKIKGNISVHEQSLVSDIRKLSGGLYDEITALIERKQILQIRNKIAIILNDLDDNRFDLSFISKLRYLGFMGGAEYVRNKLLRKELVGI